MKKRDKSNKSSVLGKLLRPIISIIVLTALVLGIALFVKEISTMSYKRVISITAPLLAKVGLSSDKAGEVAGEFIKRASDTDINIGNIIKETSDSIQKSNVKHALTARWCTVVRVLEWCGVIFEHSTYIDRGM